MEFDGRDSEMAGNEKVTVVVDASVIAKWFVKEEEQRMPWL
jgi:hypothetical protein